MTVSPKQSGVSIEQVFFLSYLFWYMAGIDFFVFMTLNVPPRIFDGLFIIGAMAMIVLRVGSGAPLYPRQEWEFTKPYWIWVAVFLVWSTVTYSYSSRMAFANMQMINQIEVVLVLSLMIYFMRAENHALIRQLIIAAAFFAAGVVVLDFFVLHLRSDGGRATGFYPNPNVAAFMLVTLMTAGLPHLRQSGRLLLVAIATFAVFLTFSRSGWLILAASLPILGWQGYIFSQRSKTIVAGYLALTGLIVALVIFSDQIALPQFLQDSMSGAVSKRLNIADLGETTSAMSRVQMIYVSIEQFMEGGHPLIGAGMAYTQEWDYRISTHNIYLLQLVEGGVISVLIYLALLYICFTRTSGAARVLLLQVFLFGFVMHNVFSVPTRLFIFAILLTGVSGYLMPSRKTAPLVVAPNAP